MSDRYRTRPVDRGREDRATIRLSTLLPWLGLLVCLASLSAALGGVFRVRQVEVVGANLPVDTIVRTAGVSGQNLFTVRSDQVVARLSRVRAIVVHRVDLSFPDRVTIYASLRPTLVAWESGGALYELDPEGMIVRQVKSTRLPIIVGTGHNGPLGPSIVQAVRYAMASLPSAPNGAVAAFRYDPGGLAIVGRAGWTAEVGVGTPQTLVDRIATLSSVLAAVRTQPRPLKFVDLRLRVPYLTYRGS